MLVIWVVGGGWLHIFLFPFVVASWNAWPSFLPSFEFPASSRICTLIGCNRPYLSVCGAGPYGSTESFLRGGLGTGSAGIFRNLWTQFGISIASSFPAISDQNPWDPNSLRGPAPTAETASGTSQSSLSWSSCTGCFRPLFREIKNIISGILINTFFHPSFFRLLIPELPVFEVFILVEVWVHSDEIGGIFTDLFLKWLLSGIRNLNYV